MDFVIGTATVDVDPPQARVRLRGELDCATVPTMMAQFEEALAARCRDFVLDLSEVSFCDASTVRLTLGLERRVAHVGGSRRLVSPSTCVRRVFELVGLGGMLDGSSDQAAAPAR